jgi:hypothetical protein
VQDSNDSDDSDGYGLSGHHREFSTEKTASSMSGLSGHHREFSAEKARGSGEIRARQTRKGLKEAELVATNESEEIRANQQFDAKKCRRLFRRKLVHTK